MNILNLETRKKQHTFKDDFYNQDDSYLILSSTDELKLLKDILNIDEITFKDCLKFDESIKLDLFENYDFLSVNTFELIDNKAQIEEVNIYLSDNFILVVCSEHHFIFEFVKDMIMNDIKMENTPSVVSLFKINYLIFKNIIIHEFESLDKVEDLILKLEDEILEGVIDDHVQKINHIRSITRTVVKNTRPLLYIGDRILKENIRYLKYSDVKKYNLDNLQGIDFGIEKLYSFALSTRELADKLLDIYSSQVAEKTNSLITKLTLLTGIAAPLTIITGIYGMNFRVMPELEWYYGYPLTLGVMIFMMIVGVIIFKIKKLL
ncbi:CorA family divalent cation transporter [Romboutsia sedimentorum]|uniref:CorA family divalent cation transporter n=1 Tax=Romboutsia sedimentorum TaxID=1368474 RepID=A0ABT7E4S7_9FIRM|nr:CorA family divalent cation transporter [Romboutsia sedimentorum]MDK2561930.1 CorA family divalent cation transporter [Romboutsia sedimentorum]MDK2586724.1 CorA family divalent cation transporter [Romboutsia sedimentorum]